MALVIGSVMRALDIFFGVLGLILILRIALQMFNVSPRNTVMQILRATTDPVLWWVARILGITPNQYYAGPSLSFDLIAALASVILLWLVRSVLMWVLQLILLIPTWLLNPLASVGSILAFVLTLIFELYSLALLVRILFEWIRVPYSSRVMRFLWDITEPVLAPIRRVLPPFAGLDFSPLVAFFLLRLLEQVVLSMVSWIF